MSVFAASMSAQRGNNIDARKLQLALYAISNLYVDSTSETKLVEDAIVGMLEKLDPHSTYTDPEETKEMTEPLQGNFDGIGIQFNMLTDTLYVIQVIPGGPSEKVGLMAGDRIIMVDDTLIAGVKMKNTDVMKRLRGPKNTEVRVSDQVEAALEAADTDRLLLIREHAEGYECFPLLGRYESVYVLTYGEEKLDALLADTQIGEQKDITILITNTKADAQTFQNWESGHGFEDEMDVLCKTGKYEVIKWHRE